MKGFLKKLLIFLLPMLVIAVSLELFIVYYPSAFNTKVSFIKNNTDIELLVLGSSHNQQAINPEFLNYKAANLAYGGQDLYIDAALFNKYAKDLESLKYLVLELDYHTMEFRQPHKYFRFPWYYRYHNIKLGYVSGLRDFLLYPSSPQFFNNYIWEKVNTEAEKVEINDWGYETNRFSGEFEEVNYNEEAIEKLANAVKEKRHRKISPENLMSSKNIIDEIVAYCSERNIEVILISSPMYKTYLDIKIAQKEQNRMRYVDSLVRANNKVVYLNYESDDRFVVKDFRNEDHLNPDGARKFTLRFSKAIDSLSERSK